MSKLKDFLGIYSFSSFLRIPKHRFSVTEEIYVVGYYQGTSFRKVYSCANHTEALQLLKSCKEVHYPCTCVILRVMHSLSRL